jgi:hypothetical protein
MLSSSEERVRQILGITGLPCPFYCSFRDMSFTVSIATVENHLKIILIFSACAVYMGRILVIASPSLQYIIFFCYNCSNCSSKYTFT